MSILNGSGQCAFAVDTGGTFTDLVLDTGADLRMFKALTTPEDPVDGVLDVLSVAAEGIGTSREELLAAGELFLHGTTRAINALVTQNTARTGLLATAGHPDVLLFREGGRSEPFDFGDPYPEPLVPRSLTFELPGRIAADGRVVEPLDEDAVIEAIQKLAAEEVEAVAVALLWSIVNGSHELRVGQLLEENLPGIPYTLSHQLNPTLREYRRTSSACIDAALKPLMTDYFGSLQERLAAAGFGGRLLVLTSQGAMLDAGVVAEAPIHSINSGPSMAPVAGRHVAQVEADSGTVIVADAGGTTFDVTVVRDGSIPRTRETWIGAVHQGHITGFPSVDVTSVGAGGGSIAWVDDGGLLQVGPRSAGSTPGPACYGAGGVEPTLTDASLVLGYLDPDFFLGGAMRLDPEAARDAIRTYVAEPLSLEVEAAAAAVLLIATENMVHAIEEITVHQGVDPRQAVLVGGGGAAGLNLVAIAARLGCARVLIPDTGAALSASGALLSDISSDFAATHVATTGNFDYEGVAAVLDRLRGSARKFVGEAADESAPHSISLSVEARYPRQNWEIEVALPGDGIEGPEDVAALAEAFHDEHERLFAISERDSEVEVVGWRAEARLPMRERTQRRLARGPLDSKLAAHRRVWLDGGWVEAALVNFDALPDGSAFEGPAIVESSFTTVVVGPEARGRKSAEGHLDIELEQAR